MKMFRYIISKGKAAIVSIFLLCFSLIIVGCNSVAQPTSFDPNFRLIIPETTVVSPAGHLDGLNSDAKWSDAFSLDLIDGVSASGVIMEGVADSNSLYLYFDIQETDLSSTDVVVIALNPSSGENDKRLLLIEPCPLGAAGCPATSTPPGDPLLNADVDYYIDSDNDGNWEPTAGHGVTAQVVTSGGTAWAIEVMIPRGAPFNLPDTGWFGFYANVIETSFLNVAGQYTWPFNNDAGNSLITGVLTDTPSDSVWGNATLDASVGSGVRISSSDISTNHGPSTISWDEPNTFYANVHNNTLSGGSLVTASDVRATFSWANFGLPSHSSFQTIPTAASPAIGNPTSYDDILPTATNTYQFDWTVPVADQAFYSANPHWCIRVELDSTNGNTVFYRQQAQRNMNFTETSSPFVSLATIDSRGYELPQSAKFHEYIIEERFYNFDPKLQWKSELGQVDKIAEGKYKAMVDPKKSLRMNLSVLPPEKALVPYKTIDLKPSEDSVVRLKLRAGQLITLIKEPRRKNEKPNGNSGIIWASWDDFEKSSFLVGNSISLKAPKNTGVLSLKVKGNEKNRANKTSIKLRTYITDIKDYHLQGNPSLRLDRDRNGIVNLGANLPSVIYRGKRDIGKMLKIKKKNFKVYQPTGAFGYIVKGKKVI